MCLKTHPNIQGLVVKEARFSKGFRADFGEE
jgi:hypothetical protein